MGTKQNVNHSLPQIMHQYVCVGARAGFKNVKNIPAFYNFRTEVTAILTLRGDLLVAF